MSNNEKDDEQNIGLPPNLKQAKCCKTCKYCENMPLIKGGVGDGIELVNCTLKGQEGIVSDVLVCDNWNNKNML